MRPAWNKRGKFVFGLEWKDCGHAYKRWKNDETVRDEGIYLLLAAANSSPYVATRTAQVLWSIALLPTGQACKRALWLHSIHRPRPSANITRPVKTFTTNKERFQEKKHYIISWWHWGVRSDEADSVNSSISKSRGICFFELYGQPLITAESSIWLRGSSTRYKRSGFIIYLFFFIWLFNLPPLLYMKL